MCIILLLFPFGRRDLNLKPIELPANKGSSHKSPSPVYTADKGQPGGTKESKDSSKRARTVISEKDIPPDI